MYKTVYRLLSQNWLYIWPTKEQQKWQKWIAQYLATFFLVNQYDGQVDIDGFILKVVPAKLVSIEKPLF